MDADESYMDVFMRSHKPDLCRRLIDEEYLKILTDVKQSVYKAQLCAQLNDTQLRTVAGPATVFMRSLINRTCADA